MKAISIRQPWASLIVGIPGTPGPKDVENRVWKHPPKYRGTLMIHAGQMLHDRAERWHEGLDLSRRERLQAECLLCDAAARNSGESSDELVEEYQFAGGVAGRQRKILQKLPRGIIGVVNFTGVVTESSSPWFEGGGYVPASADRRTYGFVFERRRAFYEPLECSGQLGIFNVPVEVAEEIALDEEYL